AEDRDVGGALLAKQLEHTGEQIVVRARQDREADRVRILLDGCGDDLLGRLVEPCVDDLEARVAKGPRHDLGPPVMAIEPRLGDRHADLSLNHHRLLAPPTRYAGVRAGGAAETPLSAARMRSALFEIASRSPGTSVQSKPLPSSVHRGIRCKWKWGTD